ncbi:histidine-phosphotransfer domain, HPT domain-containing protein, partial [Auriscalpium vulgare]
DFSRSTVQEYFTQAVATFVKMQDALTEEKLKKLSELGHFLKGSSAALGVARVQESCELIQHYGHLRDEERPVDLSRAQALAYIAATLARVCVEYADAERWLRDWYAD